MLNQPMTMEQTLQKEIEEIEETPVDHKRKGKRHVHVVKK
jgi:hypothetical protein